MISSEAPALFAKACEMFILELTLRSWNHAEENKRRTLQRDDIAAALNTVEVFDFLVDVVPQADLNRVSPTLRCSSESGGACSRVDCMGKLHYMNLCQKREKEPRNRRCSSRHLRNY